MVIEGGLQVENGNRNFSTINRDFEDTSVFVSCITSFDMLLWKKYSALI